MSSALQKVSCLALLVVPLALITAAQAEQPNSNPAPVVHANADAPPSFEAEDELNAQGMARQEIREEMQKIREEHENLEAEHDQLKTVCMNAKGQEHSQCQQKWRALHEQVDALHIRMRTLHDKMETARQEHHGGESEHHAMNNRDQPAREERPEAAIGGLNPPAAEPNTAR